MANKTKLTTSPAVEAVLRGAMAKEPVENFTREALQKCSIKGWIQFEGNDGELLALTINGRKACEALGFIA